MERKKVAADKAISDIQLDIAKNNGKIENLGAEKKSAQTRKDNLSQKITISDQNRPFDEEAGRLIDILKKFLYRFKKEKEDVLAEKMKSNLQSLLHKRDLFKYVRVDIDSNGNDMDISLYRDDGKIDISKLSMGERQMFVTALLSALVDETEIVFPVFIDSPMQKYDRDHAKSVLMNFYPNVSKQVVLFPLLEKELTKEEYVYIQSIVSKCYLINNEENASHFVEVKPEDLFEVYSKNGHAN